MEVVAFLSAGEEGVCGDDEDDSDDKAFHVGHRRVDLYYNRI
jgi:hypothetical protein